MHKLKGRKQSLEHIEKRRQALIGKKLSLEHRRALSKGQKGREVWNKGLKITGDMYTKIYADRTRPDMLNDKNYSWKGEKASYGAKHRWIYQRKGKALKCSNVNCTFVSNNRKEWANISKDYQRDTNDYIELCPSCHRKWDAGSIDIKVLPQDLGICIG